MENTPNTSLNTPEIDLQPEQIEINPPKNYSKVFIVGLILIASILIGIVIFLIKKPAEVLAPGPDMAQEETVNAPTNIPKAAVTGTETTDWLTYTDPKAGFSFKYPKNISLNGEKTGTKLVLNVSAEKLADIPEDLPMMLGRADAIAEKTLLAKGGGENQFKINKLNGQISMTLGQFEVCSVMFVRKLKFYPGEYRVSLALTAPKNQTVADMPEFFKIDRPNCGEALVWNQAKINDFEPTLKSQQGKALTQSWYNTFTKILSTIQVVEPTAEVVLPTAEVANDAQSYKNTQYNFELSYKKPYKVLTDKSDLSGYPNGIALLYTGGQAYDIVIEAWETQASFESHYASRMSDLKLLKIDGKFITLLNNTGNPENQKIIDSLKLTAN